MEEGFNRTVQLITWYMSEGRVVYPWDLVGHWRHRSSAHPAPRTKPNQNLRYTIANSSSVDCREGGDLRWRRERKKAQTLAWTVEILSAPRVTNSFPKYGTDKRT